MEDSYEVVYKRAKVVYKPSGSFRSVPIIEIVDLNRPHPTLTAPSHYTVDEAEFIAAAIGAVVQPKWDPFVEVRKRFSE